MNAPVAFDKFAHADLSGEELPWLAGLRARALAAYAARGLPTLRDEEWKYTSVASIERGDFSIRRPATADFLPQGFESLFLAGTPRLVFIDGCLARPLCDLSILPSDVAVGGLADMLEHGPEHLRPMLEQASLDHPSVFAALNTACMSDGAVVHLPADTEVAAPIHLLFITVTPGLAAHSRNLVIAEAGSRASIIEHHVSRGAAGHFTNAVTDILVDRGAAIEHHKLQEEGIGAFHIAAVRASLGRASRFLSTSFALGARLARVDIGVDFNAAEGQCTLDGLYLADGHQHVDHHTRIDHRHPGCTSRQLYKGVLAGAARGVFNGKVVVHADAQLSDAAQINRNLLLSEHAEVDTKPQLEIWADNVKCSHGATVSQLDGEQIFYLRSRGLADSAAQALLIHGFAAEMAERLRPVDLRTRLERLLHERLPANGVES